MKKFILLFLSLIIGLLSCNREDDHNYEQIDVNQNLFKISDAANKGKDHFYFLPP